MIMGNTVSIDGLGVEFTYPEEVQNRESNAESFISIIKSVNRLPFDKGTIFFSDSRWDFSQFSSLNISKKSMKFNFDLCCDIFRDEAKSYVLIQILENNCKIQTTHKEYGTLYLFFNAAEKSGFFAVQDITDNFICGFIESRSDSIRQELWVKTVLRKFFMYYSANFKDVLSDKRLKLFDNKNIRAFYAHAENSKFPNIPDDYYNGLLSATIKIAQDPSRDKNTRGIACIMIIMMQTGLRTGECIGLQVNALKEVMLFNGERAYYLNYRTWKRNHGNNVSSTATTYVNELTKQAYDLLLEIYSEDRIRIGVNYLYLGSQTRINKGNYPIDTESFKKGQLRFYAQVNEFFQIVNLPEDRYPELTRKQVSHERSITNSIKDAQTLTIPHNHQFRVHVCTELYNKGVPLKYIQKFMAHLSSEMEGYYVRPKKQSPQENMSFSMETMKKIVSGEITPLGGADASGLVERINDFIAKNHYNVQTDMDAICNSLLKKIPIRQKTGGVCIKSSMLRECSKDAMTNEFYCAYGVCPNIFHFFYMADVSYRQCKELEETIRINKENGFMRQVQKESNMLRSIAKNKLLPELAELRNTVNKKSAEAVIMEYPDLSDIIEHLEDIEKEATAWISSNQ